MQSWGREQKRRCQSLSDYQWAALIRVPVFSLPIVQNSNKAEVEGTSIGCVSDNTLRNVSSCLPPWGKPQLQDAGGGSAPLGGQKQPPLSAPLCACLWLALPAFSLERTLSAHYHGDLSYFPESKHGYFFMACAYFWYFELDCTLFMRSWCNYSDL